MTKFDHVRVLSAYLMRLPPIVFKRLNEANLKAWNEQLNGNKASQMQSYEHELQVIRAAIDSMTDADLAMIENIVTVSADTVKA